MVDPRTWGRGGDRKGTGGRGETPMNLEIKVPFLSEQMPRFGVWDSSRGQEAGNQ